MKTAKAPIPGTSSDEQSNSVARNTLTLVADLVCQEATLGTVSCDLLSHPLGVELLARAALFHSDEGGQECVLDMNVQAGGKSFLCSVRAEKDQPLVELTIPATNLIWMTSLIASQLGVVDYLTRITALSSCASSSITASLPARFFREGDGNTPHEGDSWINCSIPRDVLDRMIGSAQSGNDGEHSYLVASEFERSRTGVLTAIIRDFVEIEAEWRSQFGLTNRGHHLLRATRELEARNPEACGIGFYHLHPSKVSDDSTTHLPVFPSAADATVFSSVQRRSPAPAVFPIASSGPSVDFSDPSHFAIFAFRAGAIERIPWRIIDE
jgi:hypothetical protein